MVGVDGGGPVVAPFGQASLDLGVDQGLLGVQQREDGVLGLLEPLLGIGHQESMAKFGFSAGSQPYIEVIAGWWTALVLTGQLM